MIGGVTNSSITVIQVWYRSLHILTKNSRCYIYWDIVLQFCFCIDFCALALKFKQNKYSINSSLQDRVNGKAAKLRKKLQFKETEFELCNLFQPYPCGFTIVTHYLYVKKYLPIPHQNLGESFCGDCNTLSYFPFWIVKANSKTLIQYLKLVLSAVVVSDREAHFCLSWAVTVPDLSTNPLKDSEIFYGMR